MRMDLKLLLWYPSEVLRAEATDLRSKARWWEVRSVVRSEVRSGGEVPGRWPGAWSRGRLTQGSGSILELLLPHGLRAADPAQQRLPPKSIISLLFLSWSLTVCPSDIGSVREKWKKLPGPVLFVQI